MTRKYTAHTNRSQRHRLRWSRVNSLSIALLLALSGLTSLGLEALHPRSALAAPTTPPALICGNDSILGGGPTTPPAGAIVVPAGDNSALTPNWVTPGFSNPGQTFWFAPGVHTLGNDQFAQIGPGDNSTFIGAPGAIIDGQRINESAFSGTATNVTIKYLTIQNFVTPQDQGTINHDMGDHWTVTNITATRNDGAAVLVGPNGVLRDSCLTANGQYGFQGLGPNGPDFNITVDHNEVSYNNTNNTDPGCGCSGGNKFWDVRGADITNNYIHDNRGTGLWADTNDTDFLIEGNYISDNDGQGLFYEISYNMVVRNNTFLRNGLVAGPDNPSFPTGAIYLSEAGGDSRVPSLHGSAIDIYDNVFTDNYSGVILWENADRFCGSPANTSTDYCTLVNPSAITGPSSCNATTVQNEPYTSDCRWKTQNVQVHHNVFNFTPANIGPSCTPDTGCGKQGIFSNYGTTPNWSPYLGTRVQNDIARNQNNRFHDNTYTGPWTFAVFEQGDTSNFATWQTTWGQDTGSTYNGGAGQPPDNTAPTNVVLSAPSSASGTVTLSATAQDNVGVTRVEFYQGTSLVGTANAPASGTAANGTWRYAWDTTTVANGTYSLTAKAYDAAGNGPTVSAPVDVNVVNANSAGPTTPQNLRTTSVTSSRVALAWDASTDAVAPVTGYQINRKGPGETSFRAVGTTGDTSGFDASVAPGTTYQYTVEAYSDGDSFRHSAPSTAITVTTPGAPAAVEPATNLSASATGPNQVDLQWTASATTTVTKYYIVRNGVTVAETGIATNYRDTAVQPSTHYSYAIIASDGVNNSTPSNTASVDTPAVPDTMPPSVPQGLGGVSVSDTQINLSWQPSADNAGGSGVAGYNVFRNGTKINTVGLVTSTALGDTGLVCGTSYNYTVSAVDANGNESAQSAAATLTTGPTTPQNLRTTSVTSSRVDLAWDASTNSNAPITGYQVQRKVQGAASFTTVGTTAADTTTWGDTVVTPGTTYVYRVEAYSDGDNSRHSPSSAELTVAVPAIPQSQVSGRVTDSAGKAINGVAIQLSNGAATSTNGNGKYTLNGVPAGTYTLTASKSGYQTQTKTVTVSDGNPLVVNITLVK